ncbi:hypothetical protein [Crocosphaera sp. XPORK-15E]|uniref:hypothetical protein n=1 Tax=Crocosphaera sp. XPORK-15E TaxID=3110247 RepID=UPI002B217601|nr:hypothetical protein [Crocosphaera sp. XPORK-15E]MEA5535394.1 hypothetical protein [Crocosphaera sp. XPORK-15E]
MNPQSSEPNYELEKQQDQEPLFPSEYSLLAKRRLYPEDEIENLLEFAEDIKKICDNYLDKLEQLMVLRDLILGFFGFLYCLSLIIIYFYIDAEYPPSGYYSKLSFFIQVFIALSSLLFFVITIVAISLNSRINKIKTKLNYEQNVLTQTVDLIREAIAFIVVNNGWTTIQEIEFKIRLSRFNTGTYKMPQSVLKEILSPKSRK